MSSANLGAFSGVGLYFNRRRMGLLCLPRDNHSRQETHSAPASPGEVSAQGALHRLVGSEQHVIDLGAGAGVAQFLAKTLEVGLVLAAQPLRIDQQPIAAALQV